MDDAEVESKDELASLEADQEVLYVTLNTLITKVSGSLASTTATAGKRNFQKEFAFFSNFFAVILAGLKC